MTECIEKKQYSEQEKILLLSLVDEYKGVIENKRTDGTYIKKKQEIWARIERFYNASSSTKRSVKQLKKLWDNLKQKTRRSDSEHKNQMLQTGGGPAVKEESNPIYDKVRSIAPSINIEVTNSYDSVAVFERAETSAKPREIEAVLINNTDHDHDYEIVNATADDTDLEDFDTSHMKENSDTTNNIQTYIPVLSGIKRQRVMSKQGTSRQTHEFIEQEATLRIKKLKEAIRQQEQLHILKIEAATAEKEYWQKKQSLK